MSPAERLDDARCLLLAHEPWYGHAAMMMTWHPSTLLETMGVRVDPGGEVQCLYNEAFVTELERLELYAVIQHEIEHVVRCHCSRTGSHSALAWNIAADMVVNGTAAAPRIGYRDDGLSPVAIPWRDSIVWTPADWPSDMNAEHYYGRLVGSDDLHQYGVPLDDHSIWDDALSPEEHQAIVSKLVSEVAAKCPGSMPGHLQRPVAQPARSEIPWPVLLERYLRVGGVRRKRSHSRRNRRRDVFGEPGFVRQRRRHVSVIVDVSGSVQSKELRQFFSELERLCEHARVDLLLWDCTYQGFQRDYQPGDWRKIDVRGGGGTDMAAPVDWLVEQRAVGDCVILLTDGICNWPARRNFPLITAITRHDTLEPDWGKVVRITPHAPRSRARTHRPRSKQPSIGKEES